MSVPIPLSVSVFSTYLHLHPYLYQQCTLICNWYTYQYIHPYLYRCIIFPCTAVSSLYLYLYSVPLSFIPVTPFYLTCHHIFITSHHILDNFCSSSCTITLLPVLSLHPWVCRRLGRVEFLQNIYIPGIETHSIVLRLQVRAQQRSTYIFLSVRIVIFMGKN